MGLFDEVLFECPACGTEIREQTKATSSPYLNKFKPHRVGAAVCVDLVYGEWDPIDGYFERDLGAFTCDCGVVLYVKTDVPSHGRLWLEVVDQDGGG